ncbi:PAS domain-containing sensor histidine kinase [Methanoculleus sp. YWC-01]|uniref:histidine kinase n=1 Tax=Methanoculleus nereidis TaxID=2735141 RepID=A0ABU3Z2Z4_9EURY|nr:PAS domain-containing sensor histidine kinase [Methanoculleus sp. YWC-01]MDV4343193.1 PAS domain-containing sensor histidine kinase [Methanoculleus sp. YWC-01]
MVHNDQETGPDVAITPNHTSDQNQLRDPPDNSAERTCCPAKTHNEIVWVRGLEGRKRVYLNFAAENVWGIDAQTLLENSEALIGSIHPDDRESFKILFDGELAGENPSDYRIILPDGTIRLMRARCFSTRGEDNQVLYIGTATDITEERDAATARESEAEQRSNFLSITSHELRTPLQPVLGYLHLMLDNPQHFGLTAEGVQYLNVIRDCANRMSSITNRILVMSLADAERELVQPYWETISLEQLAADIVGVCNTGDGMAYTIDIPPGQMIETDRNYLYEALYEICGNAVKHSAHPCHVVFRYAEESGNHVISISDDGPGMDEATRTKLFQPFYIGDRNNLSRMCGRLGLGLTIARKNIEILGGTVSVDSIPQQGSTFTIRLPKQHP